MNNGQHWQSVYRDRSADEVSWYQSDPRVSLSLIRGCGLAPDAALLDVGGGASVLARDGGSPTSATREARRRTLVAPVPL